LYLTSQLFSGRDSKKKEKLPAYQQAAFPVLIKNNRIFPGKWMPGSLVGYQINTFCITLALAVTTFTI
jgi:hypothetical protein